MRIINCLPLALCFAFGLFGCARPPDPGESNLHGIWSGYFKDYSLIFRFNEDSTCELRFSKHNSSETIFLLGNYEIHASKRPVVLLINNIQLMDHDLYCALRFIDESTIRISRFSSSKKSCPVAFNVSAKLVRAHTAKHRAMKHD